ncbi:MAG TPA: hypothetical protein VHX65_19630 [Pirellulales bacterium]|jgi:hypothetical protein|nr:hypothetical protein [Pirellulales bacterium]
MTTNAAKLCFLRSALGALVALACCGAVTAQVARLGDGPGAVKDKWGSIKGRFVYDGKVPAPVKIKVPGNINQLGGAFCGKLPLVQEDLVVSASGGIANVVVWVRNKRLKVHPDYKKTAGDTVVLDNSNCHFVPHVVGVRVGQTLAIKNSDPIAHNTKIDGLNTQANPLVPSGQTVNLPILASENLPAPMSCSIHPWMNAWLIARPNPYFAISDQDGNFEIKNMPAGDIEFQFWHERVGYLGDVVVGGQPTKWPKGRMKQTIKPDTTADLGTIKIKL